MPLAFFVRGEAEVVSSLRLCVQALGVETEQVVPVVYQPQAVFRVRAVARCTSTLQGHTEAVISTAFSPTGKWVTEVLCADLSEIPYATTTITGVTVSWLVWTHKGIVFRFNSVVPLFQIPGQRLRWYHSTFLGLDYWDSPPHCQRYEKNLFTSEWTAILLDTNDDQGFWTPMRCNLLYWRTHPLGTVHHLVTWWQEAGFRVQEQSGELAAHRVRHFVFELHLLYTVFIFVWHCFCRSVCGIQRRVNRSERLWPDTPSGSLGSAGNLFTCEHSLHQFISFGSVNVAYFTADLKSHLDAASGSDGFHLWNCKITTIVGIFFLSFFVKCLF